MQSTNVREINAAVLEQAMQGRGSVRIDQGRVIEARKRKGQLQAKTMSGTWHIVESVIID